jgi:ribonucleoside-triphosphate reductase
LNVIKRDGRVVDFDRGKISNAIIKSMASVNNCNTVLANKIAVEIERINTDLSVEEIQDLVEKKLMASNCKDVAKAYIIYRNDRTRERERNSSMLKKIWERTNATHIENLNANVDENSFSGREKEASSDIQKEIALEYVMSKEISDAHKNGLIYQHDLDKYNLGMHNCLNLDFEEIFKNGFSTRNGDVRPPTSFSTACQLVAVAFQCQSQVQYGGVASVHLDRDLAPFVKMSYFKHYLDGLKYINCTSDSDITSIKECIKTVDIDNWHINDTMFANDPKAHTYAMDMLEKEGRQAAQGLYHNLNTLESRQGSQVPFTSINFGRDTTPEGRLVSKWMLEASLDGIGKYHRTSIFPISIFQYKKGVNSDKDNPNYDLKQLALKSLSRRIYPNWCNGDWSQAHEDESNPDTFFSTMGCRTLVGYDRHGLGYTRVGRGNNNPITIILPKLGIEYGICLGKRDKADLEGFWEAFEDTLKLVEKAHLERFEIMAKQSPKAAPFMYANNTIKDGDKCTDNVYEALKHNTFAIGYIGIAEMCQALFGENHVHNKDIHNFALSVVKRINEFALEASERNNLNFSCYATPAENLCKTAVRKLRSQYGSIKNVTDREYLTNSHHVPVWEEVSVYDKLNIEAPFCKYPTGGCITYIECESTFMQNTKAVEDIIDYAFQNLDIPYLAINFPIDTCLDCGYQSEFNDKCPVCGSHNIEQLRRVTGYLTTDWHNFNEGKQAEVNDRVKHTAFHDLGAEL